MKNSNHNARFAFICIILSFLLFVVPSKAYADKTYSQFVEEQLCNLLITVGDSFKSLLNAILGEDMTVSKIIYTGTGGESSNLFNPNFFDSSNTNSLGGGVVKQAVSSAYSFFTTIAVTIYVIALLGAVIQIIASSTERGLEKGKEFLLSWLKGVIVLFFMPYVMSLTFTLNSSLIKLMLTISTQASVSTRTDVQATTNSTEWSAEEIEFRSPEYVSNYTGNVTFGSEEANEQYANRIQEYTNNFDIVNVARAYSGATHKLIYVFIWYITLFILVSFIVTYAKRFFMIGLLIGVFPIICVFDALNIAQGKPSRSYSNWFKTFVGEVSTQFIHVVVYSIITTVSLTMFANSLSGGAINWLILILALNFIPTGEKLLKGIFSKFGSGGGMNDAKGSAKQAMQLGKQFMGAIKK